MIPTPSQIVFEHDGLTYQCSRRKTVEVEKGHNRPHVIAWDVVRCDGKHAHLGIDVGAGYDRTAFEEAVLTEFGSSG